MLRFITVAITAILLLGCQNNSTATPKVTKALPSKSDKIIRDSAGHYRIYQRPDKSFYVYRGGRIVYDRLKFISPAPLPGKNNMQALDKDNRLLEFALYGAFPDMPLCGVGSMTYRMDISEGAGGFEVSITLTGGDMENYPKAKQQLHKVHHIATISKSSVDDIYFTKHKKSVTFEGSLDDDMLYYRRGKQYGFYGKLKRARSRNIVALHYSIQRQGSGLYDAIKFAGKDVLLQKNGLWGCHGKTAIKYAKLAPFRGVLARFTLPDGRKGYVTDRGMEYYD